MNNLLRVLILEDSEHTTVQLVEELQRGDYTLRWNRVETPKRLKSALAEQPWDVVLTNPSLPHCDSATVLATLQAAGLHLPCIVVAAPADEQRAVAALAAGAQDYLLTDNLTRLVPAVQRERRMAQLRQEHTALLDELTCWYTATQEQSATHAVALPQGSAQPNATSQAYIPYDTAFLLEHLTTHRAALYEARTHVTALSQTNAQLQAELAACQQAEQALHERMEQSVELAGIIIFRYRLHPVPGYDYISSSVTTILEYTPEECSAAPHLWWQRLSDESRQLITDLLHGPDVTPTPCLLRWFAKSGKEVWLEQRISVERDATGQAVAVEGFLIDVTARTRIEAELHHSQALLQGILDHSPATMFVKDPTGRILLISRDMATNLHLTPEEMIGRYDSDFVPPDVVATWRLHDQQVLATGQPLTGEEQIPYADGLHTYLAVKFPLYDTDGKVFAIGGVSTDITERKRAEAALRESQQFIEKITATMPDLLYVYDLLEERNVYVNREITTILGYTPQAAQALGKLLLPTLFHPDDAAQLPGHYSKLFRLPDGEVLNSEFRMQHADGTWRWLAFRETIFARTTDGVPAQILGIAQDVTEHKQAQAALRASQTLLHQIIDHAPAIILVKDTAGRYLLANRQLASLLKTDEAEILGKTDDAFFPPAIAAAFRANEQQVITTGQALTREELVALDAGIYTNFSVIFPIPDKSGAISAVGIIATDITERKRAEAALHESQQFIEKIMLTMPEIVYVYDLMEQRSVYNNDQVSRLLGYTPQELQTIEASAPTHLLHPDDTVARDVYLARYASLRDGEVVTQEYRLRRADGVWRWFVSRVTIFARTADGTPAQILGVSQDITEQKAAAAALQETQALLQSILDHSPVSIIITDTAGHYRLVNRHTFERYGLTDATQMLGKTVADFVPPAVVPGIRDGDQQVLATGTPVELECTIPASVGDRILLGVKFPIYDAAGTISGIGTIATDITEHKRAAQALQQSQAMLQAIIDYAPLGVFVKDLHGQLLLFNRMVAAVHQLDPERDIGKHESELFPPEMVAVWNREDQAIISTGHYLTVEEVVDTDAGTHTFLLIKFPILNTEGNIWAIGGAATDITDLKRAEHVLRASEDRLQRVIQSMPILIDAFDAQGNIVFWNDACVQTTGYTAAEIIGNPRALELLYPDPDYRAQLFQIIADRPIDLGVSEWNITNKDGRVRTIAWTDITQRMGVPEWVRCGIGVDVTEQRQAEEAYRVLVNYSLQGLSIMQDAQIIFANPAACAMTGYTLAEMRAMGPEHVKIMGHPDDQARVWEYYYARLAGRPVPSRYEMRLIRKDGQMRWLEVFPVRIEYQGRPATQMAYIDISERKVAEAEIESLTHDLARQTIELRAVNAELEAFSFSIAHDLRNPLWVVDGLSETLYEEYAEQLGAAGQDFLQRIRRVVQQMVGMLEALLALSMVTRHELELAPVDLSTLAAEIMSELRQRDPHRTVEWDCPANVIAEGDPQLLRIVLMNLLENAWKFTQKQPQPHIVFGRRASSAEVVYFVRDNGVGFATDQTDRIFRPFQRLHDKRDFAGTGIGLATVQRIIQRHGGRIWAESAPGAGATLYFTLVAPRGVAAE